MKMRSTLFVLLLTSAGTAHAALPRVVLEAPLAPASAPAALSAAGAALPSSVLLAAPSAPSLPLSPAASAPLPAAARPAALVPVAALAPAAGIAPTPAPALAPLPAHADGPKNRALEHGAPRAQAFPDSANSDAVPLENAAAESGRDFDASAPRDSAGPVPPAVHAETARAPLLPRLMERVEIEDGGVPERRAAIMKALERMIASPSGSALTESFLADGATALIRFDQFEGSELVQENGRKVFRASRAFTEWREGRAIIRLNLDYLGADAHFREQDLPPTLAHELLGHGLGYSRVAKVDALQAYHHHDLNEMTARAIGWLVDFELDGFFEESGAWSYLSDPAAYLEYMKSRLPFYALTFSNEEMRRPLETLDSRLASVRAKRAERQADLHNHKTWNAVIDFFVAKGGVDERRFRTLRLYMASHESDVLHDIAMMDAVIGDLEATRARFKAEDDGRSEKYLQWAAVHPMFAQLQSEYDLILRVLVETVTRAGARPQDEPEEVRRQREEHWRGQITFEELTRMYDRDRKNHPEHWVR